MPAAIRPAAACAAHCPPVRVEVAPSGPEATPPMGKWAEAPPDKFVPTCTCCFVGGPPIVREGPVDILSILPSSAWAWARHLLNAVLGVLALLAIPASNRLAVVLPNGWLVI